jgi:hypothetical protein
MGPSLEQGIQAHHEFEVEGRLLTDVGGTLGVGTHERRIIDARPATATD